MTAATETTKKREASAMAGIRTVTIQIGNSDNKLTQEQWSGFVCAVDELVRNSALEIHFFGAPASWAKYQNAAWVISIMEIAALSLRHRLGTLRENFQQDSVAWTVGKTQFV